MHSSSRIFPAALVAALLSLGPHLLRAQNAFFAPEFAVSEVPDAPNPQPEVAALAQNQPPASGSSSSQTGAQATDDRQKQKSDYEKAQEQIKEQEKQRVAGVVPQFNISYHPDAVAMTAGQKLKLAFRSATDPVTFGAAFLVAGYHEASDSDQGFPWGIKGLGERWGASYLDSFDGTMIGNGIFPAILHQDPRYFRLGHGTVRHRLLYAASTSFICKSDRTRKWMPNYSNVLGNIAAGGISNLYYPSNNTGIGLTISTGFIVTAEGAIGAEFDEFWPDISRRFLHKDPTHGLDAEARAKDQADKAAKGSSRTPQAPRKQTPQP